MKVSALKTNPVYAGDDIFDLIDEAMEQIDETIELENSVIAVTSKVVGLCESRVLDLAPHQTKHNIVIQESDYYLDPSKSQYSLMLTIKDNMLAVNAGIDESNVASGIVLFPENPWRSAQEIWQYLREEYKVKNIGVVITDSTSYPLRWGVVGRCLSYAGFSGLRSYIGEPDLFGRKMQMTQVNIAESLAATGVFAMGEAAESTPLAVITEIPRISFLDRALTDQEITGWNIALNDDVFSPILQAVEWKKGGGGWKN
jgi:F420-0:gamma-glutamyl ligase